MVIFQRSDKKVVKICLFLPKKIKPKITGTEATIMLALEGKLFKNFIFKG